LKYWETYLNRYAYPHILISDSPHKDLGIVVVIPAFKESRLTLTLESLVHCQPATNPVEVLVIINEPEYPNKDDASVNRSCYSEAMEWSENNTNPWIRFHVRMIKNIPKKKHGVGFARKAGMDEAAKRFHSIGNTKGIITGFDADSTCSENYFSGIEDHFNANPKCPGASIYFEHPLHTETDPHRKIGITQYELHLRYIIHAQRFAGFNSFQTLGSSMAVLADAYVKQGGMNTRKAGEDFYFINRIIQLGGYMDIRSVTVFPSTRSSDRVPFGTGRTMLSWDSSVKNELFTYNPHSFQDLSLLNQQINRDVPFEKICEILPETISSYLQKNFKSEYITIQQTTTSQESFLRRFYSSFNAFTVMKFLHYARDHFYNDIPVQKAASWLLDQLDYAKNYKSTEALLKVYRSIDHD